MLEIGDKCKNKDCRNPITRKNAQSFCVLCVKKINTFEEKHVKDFTTRTSSVRNRHLKNKYSLDNVVFNQMFKEQDFMCKICRKGNNTLHNFHVDHCHKTGKVRGILCSACNKALGLMKDSIESLERAIEYLKHNK